jgi:hypothetical protein
MKHDQQLLVSSLVPRLLILQVNRSKPLVEVKNDVLNRNPLSTVGMSSAMRIKIAGNLIEEVNGSGGALFVSVIANDNPSSTTFGLTWKRLHS